MNFLQLIMMDLRTIWFEQAVVLSVWGVCTLSFLSIVAMPIPDSLVKSPAAALTYCYIVTVFGFLLYFVSSSYSSSGFNNSKVELDFRAASGVILSLFLVGGLRLLINLKNQYRLKGDGYGKKS